MKKYNKVYVLAPYAFATGGIELCHQLVDCLRQKEYEAYIVYVDKQNEISQKQDITPAYIKYNIKTTNEIEDKEDNILICPEIYFDYMYNYQKIKLGFWWMSVDNHYWSCNVYDAIRFQKRFIEKLRIIKRYIFNNSYRQRNSIKDIIKFNDRIIHFYQSHYAQFHLYSKGFSQILPLSDYINMEFIGNMKKKKKENIVLYNPTKGFNYTKKILSYLPDIKFIALKNMNRDELNDIMQRAKIYIDFGHFPGKDRLSRECAINGCCIITSNEGAAYFFEDLPIPLKFKFERKNKNIPTIGNKIKRILEQYEENIPAFKDYCNYIIREKEIFYKEIDNAFFL